MHQDEEEQKHFLHRCNICLLRGI